MKRTMAADWPRVTARREIRLSPWASVIEREVEFAPDRPGEVYHAVGQPDYLVIVARTPDGTIPIVRQYRPALEQFTWELPAGLIDPGENALDGCRRELLEETGLAAGTIHALGTYSPCTSRLSNKVHSFFIETAPPVPGRGSEPGIDLRLVTLPQLGDLIRTGGFVLQLHIGAIMLAALRGHLDFDALAAPGSD